MGKPSASRLLKFFKQEELQGADRGGAAAAHDPPERSGKDRRRVRGRVHRGRRPARFGRQDGHDPQRVAVARGDERADGRREAAGGGGTRRRRSGRTVEKLEPARLGAFLADEHPQTAAVVLSKLAPQAAANVLLTLDKSARGEIIKRMMSMSKIPGDRGRASSRTRSARRVLVESSTKDTLGRPDTASPACSTNSTSRSSTRSCRTSRPPGAGDLDGDPRAAVLVRGHPAADAEGARRAVRRHLDRAGHAGAAQRRAGAGRSGAVLDRRALAAHDRIRTRAGAGNVSADDIVRARKSIASTAIKLAGEGAFELPSTQTQPERRLTSPRRA